jgi:DNA-directed RNA polymerase specialized sigma24 family protein
MPDLDRHLPAIAAGDPDAFERWVSGAEARVRDSLASFAASVDTEGVVQEALLRVWQVAGRFRPDGRPNGLLRLGVRIARNLAVSDLRARGRDVAGDEAEVTRILDALAAADVSEAPDPLLRRLIAACLEALPSRPRAALEARLRRGGVEPDEVLAGRLRMRVNTFLQNVCRARKALAGCLKRGGVDLEAIP